MIKHRKDIDGLRAVAVSAVVLYHCGFNRFFPGGFVGVDIFFVISGFLITKIILTETFDNSFSIVNFYSRRAKRILPAVVAMYIAVLLASYVAMLPSESLNVFRSVLSSALFVSNAYFYSSAGYFDDSSEFNAVLHTWSLSVEEQFYVFFPLIIIFASRFGKRAVITAILVMAGLSLSAAVLAVNIDQSAAFYLVQYRAWELLLGSILAVELLPRPSGRLTANAVALVGVVMMAGSIFLLSKSSQFPGLCAAPVCIGTALVILTGPSNTLVAKALSMRVATFVGLVSYSFYLWHWPIWVFANQYQAWDHGWQIAPIATSFVVAVASWRFIEQPFRTGSLGAGTAVKRAGVVIASMCAISIAGQLIIRQTMVAHPDIEEVAKYATYDPQPYFRSGQCFLTSNNTLKDFDEATCLAISSQKPNVVLVGDSHGAHLYPGIASIPGINVLQATSSGCRPVIGANGEKRCTQLMDYIFSKFLPRHHVDVLLLAGRWEAGDIDDVKKTVDALSSYADRIVVFGPIAEYRSSLPRLLAKSLYSGSPFTADQNLASDRLQVDNSLRKALEESKAQYVSMYRAICNPQCTVWAKEKEPLQFDYGHLTADGSRLIVSRLSGSIITR